MFASCLLFRYEYESKPPDYASGWEGVGLQRSGFSFVFRSRRTSPARFVKYEVLRTDCDLARVDRGWSQRSRRGSSGLEKILLELSRQRWL